MNFVVFPHSMSVWKTSYHDRSLFDNGCFYSCEKLYRWTQSYNVEMNLT